MPESLQQKVDRMTVGMEVTVTFNGTRPGTVTGPVTSDVIGVLFVVGRPVRFGGGGLNTNITAIDMPDPECPFEMGARVRSASGFDFTVTGRMVWCESCGAWDVEGEDGPGTERALRAPVTLVPPEPAPFQPGDKVRWNADTRAENGGGTHERAVDYCERRRGEWMVYYAGDRTKGWDLASSLELVPAEPDCPAILVTYTDGGVSAFSGVKGKYAGVKIGTWLTRSDVATVQALRPAEYLRGGR